MYTNKQMLLYYEIWNQVGRVFTCIYTINFPLEYTSFS